MLYYLSKTRCGSVGCLGSSRTATSSRHSTRAPAGWVSESPAIRARSVRGVEDRSAAENVVWNRLVYDLTNPRNSDVALGKVQGLQGANPVIAQKFERIDRIQATDSLVPDTSSGQRAGGRAPRDLIIMWARRM